MDNLENISGITPVGKLDEGGQGEIWHVRQNDRDRALKRYHKESATAEQRAIIEHLIQTGAPSGIAHRFAWPLEIVQLADGSFIGYLMPLIDISRFISFEDIEAGDAPHPGFRVLFELCRQLAECFRKLNIEGLCYCDISKNNFFFSPETGEVILCDNDNIVVDNSGMGGALGTPEYMAPEVVKNESKPSTVSDQHSLSVLLFLLLCGGNPFHGLMEHNIHVFDGDASEYIYGQEALFVFDPSDARNRLPDIPGYRHVGAFWEILPRHVQELFLRAFVQGSHNPAMRVTAMEWMEMFSQMSALLRVCSCGAENFMETGQHPCWNCGELLALRLCIEGGTDVPVEPGQQLNPIHFGESSAQYAIGEMEPHPNSPSLVLLRNRTAEAWSAMLGGERVQVESARAIPLHPGIRIRIKNRELSVVP